MSAIAYGRLEWQEEQLLGLVWLLERRGWQVSFQRKAVAAEITATLVRGTDCRSGTARSQPWQPFSSWGALQAAMVNMPSDPVAVEDIDRLVRTTADLQTQVACEQQEIDRLRSENIRLEAEAFESRRVSAVLVQRLGGTVMIGCELAKEEVSLVREEIVGGFRFTVQERPSAPAGA